MFLVTAMRPILKKTNKLQYKITLTGGANSKEKKKTHLNIILGSLRWEFPRQPPGRGQMCGPAVTRLWTANFRLTSVGSYEYCSLACMKKMEICLIQNWSSSELYSSHKNMELFFHSFWIYKIIVFIFNLA